MNKTYLPRPPFLRKPREPAKAAVWLVEWANIGYDCDEPTSVRATGAALENQQRVRRWLDEITRANLLDLPLPDKAREDIESALKNYPIVAVPTLRPPWYQPERIELRPTPDAPARLAIIMRDVILAQLHTRITKCGLRECERFVFTPLRARGRLQRYCGKTHKNRHNRRMNR